MKAGTLLLMSVESIIQALKEERSRIDAAISTLEQLEGQKVTAKPGKNKRVLSAAARKKIAAAQRARWTRQKAAK